MTDPNRAFQDWWAKEWDGKDEPPTVSRTKEIWRHVWQAAWTAGREEMLSRLPNAEEFESKFVSVFDNDNSTWADDAKLMLNWLKDKLVGEGSE